MPCACASLPAANPLQANAPAASPRDGTATQLAQWWQRFKDPVLTRLANMALEANGSVQAARGALAQPGLASSLEVKQAGAANEQTAAQLPGFAT